MIFRKKTYNIIECGNIFIRLPQRRDYIEWRHLRDKNYESLKNWEPDGTSLNLSYQNFKSRVWWANKGFEEKKVLSMLIFKKSDQALMGSITLENIIRKPFYSSNLGYWMGQEYRRLGYMSCAIECLLQFADNNWGITKFYAATLGENTPSISLLKKLNFCEEGKLLKYLKINGVWRDHLLFSHISVNRQ